MYYFNHITMMIRLVIIHSFAIVQFLFTVSSKRVPLFQRTSLNLFSLVVSIYSVQFSHSVVSDSLWPRGLHARLPCPSLTPGAYSNLSPSSWWCHPTISSYVIPFSSCLRSFPVSQLFTSGSWSILCVKFGEWVPPQMGTRDGRWRDTNLNKMLFKIFNRIYLQIMTERCF